MRPAFPAPSIGRRFCDHSGGIPSRECEGVCLVIPGRECNERTRNLEIPGLVLTHHPGMTRLSGCLTIESDGPTSDIDERLAMTTRNQDDFPCAQRPTSLHSLRAGLHPPGVRL